MAQEYKAQISLVLKTTGTVELKKAYFSNTSDSWREVGDGHDDDPVSATVTAKTITLTQGSEVDGMTDYYYYYGDIEETYTYTLFIDSNPQPRFTGKMCLALDWIKDVPANTEHVAGNGSDHTDVAFNTAHRQSASNPHSVSKSQVSLGNVENYDTTNQVTNGITAGIIESMATQLDINQLKDDTDLLITVSDLISGLSDGSTNSNEVLRSINAMLSNSQSFASMMSWASSVTEAAEAPSSTPGQKGLIYVDTANEDVYISVDIVNSDDWVKVN